MLFTIFDTCLFRVFVAVEICCWHDVFCCRYLAYFVVIHCILFIQKQRRMCLNWKYRLFCVETARLQTVFFLSPFFIRLLVISWSYTFAFVFFTFKQIESQKIFLKCVFSWNKRNQRACPSFPKIPLCLFFFLLFALVLWNESHSLSIWKWSKIIRFALIATQHYTKWHMNRTKKKTTPTMCLDQEREHRGTQMNWETERSTHTQRGITE